MLTRKIWMLLLVAVPLASCVVSPAQNGIGNDAATSSEPPSDGGGSNVDSRPPGVDAGTGVDGGTPRPEGGTPDPDAGSTGVDGGTPRPEGGTPGADDGGTSAARFFLPTGDPANTAAPTIEIDASGGIHAVFPAYAQRAAFYAYCARGCRGPSDVKVVRFDTDGPPANVMLALDEKGRPRVLVSTYLKVYYASCDERCTEQSAWRQTLLFDHQGDREVTGEALALESGKPRFLMHTYRAFLGIGQKPPETLYVHCEGNCEDAASWKSELLAEQIWEGSHLRFDANGRAHLATIADVFENGAVKMKIAGYFRCDGNCTTSTSWKGLGIDEAYDNPNAAVAIKPAISLGLTKTGMPRVLVLEKNKEGAKNVAYFECDQDCTAGNWYNVILSNHPEINAGLDLALDANGHPRAAYTAGYNVFLAWCDGDKCARADSKWDLTKVELASELKADELILWPNCTVAAWFLHSPSIALTADGAPRVGYQARDISGGTGNPDPTKPRCVAGTDMTWSRLSIMPSYR